MALLVVLGLLAVSELLWLWQSWSVREAIDSAAGPMTPVVSPGGEGGLTC
jgi:hypothetical protein